MNNTNGLISSDNKGLASIMMEKYKNGEHTLPGQVSCRVFGYLVCILCLDTCKVYNYYIFTILV